MCCISPTLKKKSNIKEIFWTKTTTAIIMKFHDMSPNIGDLILNVKVDYHLPQYMLSTSHKTHFTQGW